MFGRLRCFPARPRLENGVPDLVHRVSAVSRHLKWAKWRLDVRDPEMGEGGKKGNSNKPAVCSSWLLKGVPSKQFFCLQES